MKKLILLVLACLTLSSAQAQLFGPSSLNGALLGGLAGGIIGHNNHNQTGRGIAIGTASGLILGAIVDQNNRSSRYDNTQVPVPATYSSGNYPYGTSTYYVPADQSAYYGRPNYASSGLLLGGLAGAIIGNNNGHRTWQGALIGAGAGLLLGGIAEQDARDREAAAAQYQSAAVPASAPAQSQAQQPVTIINNYYNSPATTPMSGANSLFGRN
jgi:outer membrane lipoprotein SlyB